MTAQVSDLMVFEGCVYDVVGTIEEPINFFPAQYGLEPEHMSTACYNGYQSIFGIKENYFVLDTLRINLKDYRVRSAKENPPPKLNGVEAVVERTGFSSWRYSSVGLNINYTGEVIIGMEQLSDRIASNGDNPAWNFNRLIGLSIKEGVLDNTVDFSQKMKCYRKDKGYDYLDRNYENRLKGI